MRNPQLERKLVQMFSPLQAVAHLETKPELSLTDNKLQINCFVCEDNHPLWHCRVFLDKTPSDRAKIVAENKLCFSCRKGNRSFRQCAKPRKCNKDGCDSSRNTVLHGADRIFQPKRHRNRPVAKQMDRVAPK